MIAVLALALAATASSSRPGASPGSLRRAFEAGQRSLVKVSSPRGSGLGIVVGVKGEVLTSVDFVALHDATIHLNASTKRLAEVQFARAELGVALLALPSAAGGNEGLPPAVAVSTEAPSERSWVLGLQRGKKDLLVPKLGSIRKPGRDTDPRFFRVDVSLSNGSPVLDLKGRLLGMVVARFADGSSRALAITTLRTELSEKAP